MKLLITGATGFVGAEVLQKALEHPSITSVVTISRKALSNSVEGSVKLRSLLLADFTKWEGEVEKELQDIDGVIWCLGSANVNEAPEKIREIHIDYPLAAIKTILANSTKKVRFVYTNGALAIRDQDSKPWVAGEFRKIRGQTENELISAANANPDKLDVFITRPWGIVEKESSIVNSIKQTVFTGFTIKVDELAAATLYIALNGSQQQVWENAELVKQGKELLVQQGRMTKA